MFAMPLMNWLLLFVPVTIVLHFITPGAELLIFFSACLAIVPLAGWLGTATEQLAARTSETTGGLINATLGNAAELIIGLMAVHRGLFQLAKASLTGSIIGNILLVLGGAMLAGGARHRTQRFNTLGASSQATTLLLAGIALVVPAVFHGLVGPIRGGREEELSVGIAVVLLALYGVTLLFTFHTHRELLRTAPEQAAPRQAIDAHWPLRRAFTVLLASTALIAWVSEILVGSVEHAAAALGMSDMFVGVIIVATVGNAAEHSTAVRAALANRMDLALSIAIGSSIQIALLVAPLLVLASFLVAPRHMDLLFSVPEVTAVAVAVVLTGHITGDGESNWLEGAQLLALYLILAFVFYLLPQQSAPAAP